MLIDLNTIEFLTTEQLAKLLSISKTSVYRLISCRLIPFYKLGHNVRFKKADVLEYLEKNCVKSVT
jgi:excisionase family DNA binding protein